MRAPPSSLILLGLALPALVGCQEEPAIQRYSAPTTLPFAYEIPEGWRRLSVPGEFSILTFRAAGEHVKVTVSPLQGEAGGLAPNVNRWRRQLGLEPAPAGQIEQSAEPIQVDGGAGHLVDITGPPDEKGGQPPRRVVGVILPRKDITWFFKMDGPGPLVAAEKDAFQKLLQSVKFDGAYDGE